MRRGRLTPSESAWPLPPGYERLAVCWASDQSVQMLALVWAGFELLEKEMLTSIDWSEVGQQLEISITSALAERIQRVMTGAEPFLVQHNRWEELTRKPPPAQPPCYDIAFYAREQPRINYPLEAKILPNEASVLEYVKEIRQNFLTSRYAPLTGEGAMLGYLIVGSPDAAFREIEKRLEASLEPHSRFSPPRAHCLSVHVRQVPPEKPWTVTLRCHHLILPLQRDRTL